MSTALVTRSTKERPFEPAARLFRPGHAARFLGISKTAFYELRKQAGFPKPRLVGFSLVAMYSREDLETWVRSLPTTTSQGDERVKP